jgi:hypothetical protein
MTARQAAFTDIAREFTSGHVAPWVCAIETPVSWEMACDEFRQDTERFGSWMESVGIRREPAVWFCDSMTVSELLAYAMNSRNPDIGIAEAMKELDRRYIADCSAEIAQRAYELSTRS